MSEKNCQEEQKVIANDKAIHAQHLGFGNLSPEQLAIENMKNKTTAVEPSGKFQEKLMMQQRAQEERMMENRLKKLINEQERLNRQINIAQNTSNFATNVQDRRSTDNKGRQDWLDNLEYKRQCQNELNNFRKNEITTTIKNQRTRVATENHDSRANAGSNTRTHNDTITKFRNTDLSHKQTNAASVYSQRKQSEFKRKYDRDSYMDAIQRANAAVKSAHNQKKTAHENKLNQLNELEERLIGELQTTLQRKNQAVDILKQKSPALKKQIEPRQAYRYKSQGPRGIEKDAAGMMTNADRLAYLKQNQ